MMKPDKIFDGLLVLQHQNGDKKALPLLVKRWHVKLCKQAYWYTKDTDIAKDIAQESWRVILKNIISIKDVNSFGSWALTIVNRKAIDWLRKEKKNDEKLHQLYENSKVSYDTKEINNNIDNIATSNNTTKKIVSAINNLPENHQIIIKMFYIQEYTLDEISKILEVSKGTVKSRLFYAREKLKLILKVKK